MNGNIEVYINGYFQMSTSSEMTIHIVSVHLLVQHRSILLCLHQYKK